MYFDVIISDINMPVMNGIDFYKEVFKHDPYIRERFLFFSGAPTDEQIKFIRDNNIRLLIKPMPINEIKKNVIELINKKRTTE